MAAGDGSCCLVSPAVPRTNPTALHSPNTRPYAQTTYQEGTFAALATAGAPSEGPSYADADAAGAVLAAVAPVGVTLYERQALHLRGGAAAGANGR